MNIGKVIYRRKGLVLAIWLSSAALMFVLIPKVDPSRSELPSYLPASAPSRQAAEKLQQAFPQSVGLSEAVIVYERRDGALTDADRTAIERVADEIRRKDVPDVSPDILRQVTVRSPRDLELPKNPLTGESLAENPFLSETGPQGQAALTIVSVPTNFVTLASDRVVRRILDILQRSSLPAGLSAAVTGSSGYGHDYAVAAEDSHRSTVKVTILAVVLILLLVYRSPLGAAIPLLTIGAATAVVLSLLNLGGLFGLHVGTAESIFVFVLLYGAGIDYSLLLLSRFREELSENPDAGEACSTALTRTFPAIFASAATATAGLLMLSFARFTIFRTTGHSVAIALAVALAAGATLVPALAGIFGRKTFWPTKPAMNPSRGKLWSIVPNFVVRRPGLAMALTLAVLAGPVVRGTNLTWVYDTFTTMPPNAGEKVGNAAAGLQMARRHWPVGEISPVSVLVQSDVPLSVLQWRILTERAEEATLSIDGVGNIRSLTHPLGLHLSPAVNAAVQILGSSKVQAEYIGGDSRRLRLSILLDKPALTLRSLDAVRRIDSAISAAMSQSAPPRVRLETSLAGATAEMIDLRTLTAHDLHNVIAPLVLGVILLIVTALLRDVILSVFIVAATLLSYWATLGISYWFFAGLLGQAGLDWKVEALLFVVIAAVGVDYSIFLAARLSEESRSGDLRSAALRSMIRTGPVISSCGIIMAATLGSLMSGKLLLLVQLGFALALGMLIDTFLVRPLLLPAFVILTDRKFRSSRILGKSGKAE